MSLNIKKQYKKYQILKIKQLLQCFIKKGNKPIIENTFKKMCFFMAKNKKNFKINSWYIISQGLYNITPQLNLQTIKVKRRIFYKVKFISSNRQNLLITLWLTNSIKKKYNQQYYKNLASELNNIYFKRGDSLLAYNDFYQNIQKNIRFFKK